MLWSKSQSAHLIQQTRGRPSGIQTARTVVIFMSQDFRHTFKQKFGVFPQRSLLKVVQSQQRDVASDLMYLKSFEFAACGRTIQPDRSAPGAEITGAFRHTPVKRDRDVTRKAAVHGTIHEVVAALGFNRQFSPLPIPFRRKLQQKRKLSTISFPIVFLVENFIPIARCNSLNYQELTDV